MSSEVQMPTTGSTGAPFVAQPSKFVIGNTPYRNFTWKGWGVLSTAMSTAGYTVLAAFYLILLLLTITSSGWLKRIFSWRALRWLGTIAYGLYLIHVPALDLAFRLFEHRGPRLVQSVDLVPLTIALGGSLLLAHLSWTFFESRLVRYGHRFRYLGDPPSGGT